jgi:hypothetical protein
MIDINNTDQLKDVMTWIESKRLSPFYNSSEYGKFWNRYKKRIDAYYMRPSSDMPVWRSNLYLPRFFLSSKTLESAFKSNRKNDPFIFVSSLDNSKVDADAQEKARVAQIDLHYNLKVSNFRQKLNRMDFYAINCGTCVGREFIRSKQKTVTSQGRATNDMNLDAGQVQNQSIDRIEYTSTDIIHPLNFAHSMSQPDFKSSQWGSVRFELPIFELYGMLGDPSYNQENVKFVIEEIEDGGQGGFEGVSSRDHFYSERGSGIEQISYIDSLIVDEYYGPIYTKGNERDSTRYYVLMDRKRHKILSCVPSSFGVEIPYWKYQAYPDPDGPFGVGANDPLYPVTLLEIDLTNKRIDYVNIGLKANQLIKSGHIKGGLQTLLEGYPFGLVDVETDAKMDDIIRPTMINAPSLPSVSEISEMINSMVMEFGAANNLRGQGGDTNANTAYGMSKISERQDDFIQAMQDNMYDGMKDGLFIKMKMSIDNFHIAKVAEMPDENNQISKYLYYPYELDGLDYSFDIQTEKSDTKAGKLMAMTKMIDALAQTIQKSGAPMPIDAVIDMYEQAALATGTEDVDKIFAKIRQEIKPPSAAQVQTPGAPAQSPQGQPGAPGGVSTQNSMPQSTGSLNNAMAVA